jgi:Ca-activated chloride channel family protein
MSKNEPILDEPKLTAYALGELEGDERAAVEARLSNDAAARAAVEEIRATAARLQMALAGEALEEPQKQGAAVDPYPRAKKSKVLRFPQVYYLVGGLAAACFALVLATREEYPPQKAAEQKVYQEMTFAPPTVALPQADMPETLEALPAPDAKDSVEVASQTAVSGPVVSPEPMKASGEENLFSAELPKIELSVEKLAMENQARAMTEKVIGGGPTLAANQPMIPAAQLAKVEAPWSVRAEFAAVGEVENEVVVLSPFSVTAAPEGGYGATTTLAGARLGGRAQNTETYAYRPESEFLSAKESPFSTFSADVDTASYANVRRYLESGHRPPVDAVRIEELVNYFPYRYAAPDAKKGDETTPPFAASLEVAEAPWAPGHRLVRIGLKGREVAMTERGAANLVFLIDVSGSMDAPNKLPLVQESLRLLLGRLRPDDRVGIVTYAGASGLALPSTPVEHTREISEAIEALRPGGSTNGAMGIQLAYDIAKANFVEGGINRVILCTDGDFNVGVTSEGDLVRLIQEKAKSQVFLTVLGFGMGNLKDAMLQQIANRGNGSYGYIDSRKEAEKLLAAQVSGTLVPIAKDVKFQVEFNPARVERYRLIGYEKRMLAQEDFANDKVDAGEVGAGHTVTALYEIVPFDPTTVKSHVEVEERRYGYFSGASSTYKMRKEVAHELLTVKVRYKAPHGVISRKLEFPLADSNAAFADASDDFKFAAAVASFGMLLRDSAHKGAATYANVAQWAQSGAGFDPGGYRAEFIELVRKAEAL